MKAKSIAIVVALVVVVAAAAGFGGYSMGKGAGVAEAAAARNNFFQARGIGGQGGFGGGNSQNGRNFNPDNFAAGQVKSIDGNTIELSTATAVVKVTVSAQTQIEKPAQGTLADISQGQRLVIQGTRAADGTLAAQNIQIGRFAGGNGRGDTGPTPSR